MEVEELKELIKDIHFIIGISDNCTKKLANLSVQTMSLLNIMQREESFIRGQQLALNLTSVNQTASDGTTPSSEVSAGNPMTAPISQLTEEDVHNISYCTFPEDVGHIIGEVASIERKIHDFTEKFKQIEKQHNDNKRQTVDNNSGEIIDLSTKASGEIIDLTGEESSDNLNLTTNMNTGHTDNIPIDLSTSTINKTIMNLTQSSYAGNVHIFKQENGQAIVKESDALEKSKREAQNYDAGLILQKRFKLGVESAPSLKNPFVKNPYHRQFIDPQTWLNDWASSDEEEGYNTYLPEPQCRPARRSPVTYPIQHSANVAPKLGPMYEDPLEGPSGLCVPPPDKNTYSTNSTDDTDDAVEAAYVDYLNLMEISDHESRDPSPCRDPLAESGNMQMLLNALTKLKHDRSDSPE